VYDVALFDSLPVDMAVASGLNAVAHAVDGLWAPRADPINQAIGMEGLRALGAALPLLAGAADARHARETALYGAYLAAVAFASAGSGMHHKMCHTLGGMFNLPHAATHAVVLPYVAAFNAPRAPGASARIGAALGLPSGTPRAAARGLWELRQRVLAPLSPAGPVSLADLGLREADIAEAARIALPLIPSSNPRPVTLDDLHELLRAAWAGEEPAH
jgi:maleylacetate reductase